MCIVLISTAHPAYPFILLSNRDEFISRPTAPASWWNPPNEHVLGGRDLERKEHGTWLGITKQGRVAALTNFREPGSDKAMDKSRGGIINAYLTSPPTERETSQDFTRRLIHEVGVQDVGGFSLLFGELKPASAKDGTFPGLSILSNRSASAENLPRLATKTGETHGLSNSHFGDRSWPKVVRGEELLQRSIEADVENCERGEHSQEDFIEKLFSILSIDNLRKRQDGEVWDTYVLQMRNSIFIPRTLGPGVESKTASQVATAVSGKETPGYSSNDAHVGKGGYGTQKQTVVLVDHEGRVVYVERTLYDQDENPQSRMKAAKKFEFEIDGWWN